MCLQVHDVYCRYMLASCYLFCRMSDVLPVLIPVLILSMFILPFVRADLLASACRSIKSAKECIMSSKILAKEADYVMFFQKNREALFDVSLSSKFVHMPCSSYYSNTRTTPIQNYFSSTSTFSTSTFSILSKCYTVKVRHM